MGGSLSVDAYATHLEGLAWALARSEGPVVELGGGWYSTPMLHGFCEVLGRELFTVEDSAWFLAALEGYWPAPWHHYAHDDSYGIPVAEPGLVFVDAGTIYRAPLVLAAKEAGAQLIVVHDTEDPPPAGRPDWGEPYPGMAVALEGFAHRRDFTSFAEHTTVVSDALVLSG